MSAHITDLISLPPVTASLCIASVIITLVADILAVKSHHFYMNSEFVFKHHQYWRLLSSCLYIGSFGTQFAFRLYERQRSMKYLELYNFGNKPANFIYLCIIIWIGVLTINWLLIEDPWPMNLFDLTILYLFAMHNPSVPLETGILVINNFNIKSIHRFFLTALMMVDSRRTLCKVILCTLLGHMIYFFHTVLPTYAPEYIQVDVLEPPVVLKQLFE